MKALGTIISTAPHDPTSDEIHCGLFDYYDHWDEVDTRLEDHHDPLSHVADVFAHDLVNMSVYAQQILYWLKPENIRCSSSVVAVGALAEAFITSARSTCDVLGVALSYVAAEKKGQAPSSSLRALLHWARKNPNRVTAAVRPAFDYDFDWFWELRSIRDHLVHNGVHPTMHCDGKQFNLWLHHATRGWVAREPLLPMIASVTQNVIDLARHVSEFVQRCIPLPDDRYRTRMLHGVTVSSLYELVEVAPKYAVPSP